MFKKDLKGFTLLEVLIALSIITIGALGVFALMTRTVTSTEQNRHSIIAVNLAREGIEIVRSIRDSYSLGFSQLDDPGGVCPDATNADCNWIVDSSANFNLTTPANSSDIMNCSNCQLYISGGQYTHDSSGVYTGMKRLVNISNGDTIACAESTECEKVITVEVLTPGASTPYTLITTLTDWRQ